MMTTRASARARTTEADWQSARGRHPSECTHAAQARPQQEQRLVIRHIVYQQPTERPGAPTNGGRTSCVATRRSAGSRVEARSVVTCVASIMPLEIEEQIALYTMVRSGDLPQLAKESAARGPEMWSALVQYTRDPPYPNRGTLLHWAVWHRQFAIGSMALAAGADLSVVGEGCWMEGKTAQEYASCLDERAGHSYYEHAKSLAEALGENSAAAAMKTAIAVQAKATLDMQPFAADARLNSAETHVRLHDMVEFSSIVGLAAALENFGASIGSESIGPADNPYNNLGTLAHWAVWYQNWPVLQWLHSHGCMPPLELTGVGAWMNGRTAAGYADFLDRQCRHPFYRHRVEYEACTAGEVPPAPEVRAPAIGNPGSSQPAAHMCCVCLTEPADHIVKTCNHLCLCGVCAERITAQRGPCPVCRSTESPFESIERVFMC